MAGERGASKRPGAGLALGDRRGRSRSRRRRLVPVAWRGLGKDGRGGSGGGGSVSRRGGGPAGVVGGRGRGVDVEVGTATIGASRRVGVHGEEGREGDRGGREGFSSHFQMPQARARAQALALAWVQGQTSKVPLSWQQAQGSMQQSNATQDEAIQSRADGSAAQSSQRLNGESGLLSGIAMSTAPGSGSTLSRERGPTE